MLLGDVPWKVKLAGAAVLAVLTFSLIGATLEAVNQAVQESPSGTSFTRTEFASPPDGASASSNHGNDGRVVASLKYICPFH